MSDQRLTGLRVLVVEDEALVAIFLEDMLNDLGCEVIGLAPRVDAARELMDKKKLDCAILDVNVNGELIYPFAQVLADRAVPFLFVTGYSEASVAPQFRHRPMLQKPFRAAELGNLLAGLTTRRASRTKASKPH
jgi:DNA-binding response OmpR family regulator